MIYKEEQEKKQQDPLEANDRTVTFRWPAALAFILVLRNHLYPMNWMTFGMLFVARGSVQCCCFFRVFSKALSPLSCRI